MSATKYCNDPDHCTYSDCPTAFCDRGAEHSFAPPTLLACPFCGGKPNIVKHSHRVTVMCCCRSNGAPVAQVHAMTEDAAVEGWNLRAERGALEAMLLAASKLRIRAIHHAPNLSKFSEWEELAEAMRKAERILKAG